MKRFVCLASIALMMLAGCNDSNRLFDSEISALNRQTKVLEKQNLILERIAAALEKLKEGEP